MLAELFLTLLLGAAIVAVIFMAFFNTKKVDKKKNVKSKDKKKGKNQSKQPPNKSGGGQSKKPKNNQQKLVKSTNAAKNKPKLRLEDHDNLISVFRGHTGSITGITWHQSGKYLLSSSKDKFIYIWSDPLSPQITTSFIGSVKTQDNGYFSALNMIINTNDDDDDDGNKYDDDDDDEQKRDNPLTKYDNISNTVFAATNGCYGLNSYNLKMAATSHKIRLQITSNLQTEFVKEDIKCIGLSPKLEFIAVSGSHNTKIYFYDIKKKQRESKNKKIKVNIAPTNKASLKKARFITDKTMEVIDGGQFINYDMNISRDGNYLTLGTFKKDIRLWRINYIKPGKRDIIQEMRFGGTSLLCSIINAHKKSVTAVTFSCNSNYMISAAKDGYIKVWDIINCDYARGNKPELIIENNLEIGEIDNIYMSNQYDIAAILNAQKQSIYIYQLKYEKKKIKFHCKFDNVLLNEKDKNGQINIIKFSPDSQFIAVGTNDFDVRVYKIPAHKKSSK